MAGTPLQSFAVGTLAPLAGADSAIAGAMAINAAIPTNAMVRMVSHPFAETARIVEKRAISSGFFNIPDTGPPQASRSSSVPI